MIIETIIAALVPAAAEGIKGAAKKWFGDGIKPQTIDDQIKLDDAEIRKLESIAKLDNPGGTPSQWVIDMRASSRYIMGGAIILAAIGTLFTPVPVEVQRMALEAANVVFGFLFGSRIVAGWRK
jgi:hypothetical protein